MRKFDIQMFAEAVPGKKIVYLYRVHELAASKAGALIAFTTENGRTKSKDADSTATKDGPIRTPGAMEQEVTCTSILKQGDTFIDELETAMDEDKLLDVWEANLAEPKEYVYTLTADTDIVPGKTYYTRSGSDPNFTYTEVATPVKANLSTYYEKTATKFAGKYFQGYLTELEKTSNAEDMVELSLTFGINGTGKAGNVTITAAQQAIADYVFADTPATGA